jgi:hypothetical protein
MTREMLDAIAPGHAEVWQRYTHDRLIHVDENGRSAAPSAWGSSWAVDTGVAVVSTSCVFHR